MNPNPYSAPQSDLTTTSNSLENVPLWNPNAAACWSLIFSPVFGAILHMKNWEAMGRPDKAKESRTWAIVTGIMLLAATVISAMATPGGMGERIGNVVGLAMLVSWYMANGRDQVKLVKEAGYYEKRGWGKPLLIAILIAVALAMVVGVVAFFATSGDGISGNPN